MIAPGLFDGDATPVRVLIPFDAGRRARRAGLELGQNPHPTRSANGRAWANGWHFELRLQVQESGAKASGQLVLA